MLDPYIIRNDFPIFQRPFGNGELIYLDNAASTQKPQVVIDAVTEFYAHGYANVHRSPHRLGAQATELFEGGRAKVARYLGAGEIAETIITRGTTEAINLVAGILGGQWLKSGDVILLTPSEHHSNLIPWQMAAARSGATLDFVKLHEDGRFDPDEIAAEWNPRIKVFAFQHASNVLGTIHDAKRLCAIAKERGALTVVDGAQSAPHLHPNVAQMGCDFYAVSAHKMCGPTGVGALFGRRELLERFEPIFGGGEMIRKVWLDGASWNDIPFKFEAGTPNIAGLIGWGAAIDYLEGLGMEAVERAVCDLGEYAVQRLSELPGLTVYGPKTGRTGAVSFWMDDVHPHDIASILDMDGIAIRAGHHCAEPLMNWLGVPATARASFYFYNSREEVDRLVVSLEKVKQVMGNVA